MKVLVIIALLCSIRRSYGNSLHGLSKRQLPGNESQIVGGYEVIINQFPYALFLKIIYSQGSDGCGAIFIAPKFALTAAHCLTSSPNSIEIRVGSSYSKKGGIVYSTTQYTVHEQYDYGHPDNDIAVVDSGTNMFYDRVAAKPAVLATPTTLVPKDTIITVVGWGRTTDNGPVSEKLRAMKVPVIEQNRCYAIYKQRITVTTKSFCAGYMPGGKGICEGDSGGPAVNSRVQVVGVVSLGKGCGMRGYAGVFTRISEYRRWIKQKAKV